jgi:hypothetical protein
MAAHCLIAHQRGHGANSRSPLASRWGTGRPGESMISKKSSGFARDFPLEGTGFELPVRGRGQSDCRSFAQPASSSSRALSGRAGRSGGGPCSLSLLVIKDVTTCHLTPRRNRFRQRPVQVRTRLSAGGKEIRTLGPRSRERTSAAKSNLQEETQRHRIIRRNKAADRLVKRATDQPSRIPPPPTSLVGDRSACWGAWNGGDDFR